MRVFLLMILLIGPAAAGKPSPEDLEALRERIGELQEDLREDLEERDSLRHALRRTEVQIGKLAREKRDLQARREQARQRLDKLEARQRKMAREKATQVDWLARTVRAGYMSGRQPMLKLLLNQEQPDRLARLLRYQDYFQKARSQRVHVLNRDLEELRRVALEVEEARQTLASREQAVAGRQKKLERAFASREKALSSLNDSLGEKRQQLERLRADEARLEKLLADMASSLSDIPSQPGGQPFAKLTGKLPWPVEGKRRVDFGASREGALRWNGVLLDADTGDAVRAIHGGRVVYSDWLRGYGLLTILDHGDGYLSLYGYNQSLLRDVGEWVSTGDAIALAGNSGGHEQTGVYFEIRRKGKPVNPERWCDRRVTLPPMAKYPG